MNRRDFVKHSTKAAGAIALTTGIAKAANRSANDTIRVALTGVRGRGRQKDGRRFLRQFCQGG
jgi:hypothetical protein